MKMVLLTEVFLVMGKSRV